MIGKKFKTRYASIVRKGSVGECINQFLNPFHILMIEFENGEKFWFFVRDLKEVTK